MVNLLSGVSVLLATSFQDVSDEGFFLWPMLAFFFFIIAIIFLFLGVINLQTAKKEWSLYYNAHGSVVGEADEEYQKRKKSTDDTKKKGKLFVVFGVIAVILTIAFMVIDKMQLAQLQG